MGVIARTILDLQILAHEPVLNSSRISDKPLFLVLNNSGDEILLAGAGRSLCRAELRRRGVVEPNESLGGVFTAAFSVDIL